MSLTQATKRPPASIGTWRQIYRWCGEYIFTERFTPITVTLKVNSNGVVDTNDKFATGAMATAVDSCNNIRLPTPETEHLVKKSFCKCKLLPNGALTKYEKTFHLNTFSIFHRSQESLTLVVHLKLRMPSQIFKKFEKVLLKNFKISRKMIPEKNLKLKSRNTVPLKWP